MTTITWTTTSGHEININIMHATGDAMAVACVDGKRVAHGIPQRCTALTVINGRHQIVDAPRTINGQIIVASLGPIGLTQERYEQVMAMLSDAQLQIDRTPDGMMRKLLAARQTLASAVAYLLDAEHDEHQARIEQISADGYAPSPTRDYKADVLAARAELAAFDASHPDVLATLQAAKAENIRRAG